MYCISIQYMQFKIIHIIFFPFQRTINFLSYTEYTRINEIICASQMGDDKILDFRKFSATEHKQYTEHTTVSI